MRARLTPRALREAKRLKIWWVHNRDEKHLFDEELSQTIDMLVATPTLGTCYPSRTGVSIRRVLMKKTNNHVYFTVHEDELVVLSVWGAPRERGPKL
jgi:plasmid stabilization system protein ParE